MKPRHLIPALFFLLIAYPLSIGPVICICPKWVNATAEPPRAFTTFYQPLFWLCDEWRPLEGVLFAYINLWMPRQ